MILLASTRRSRPPNGSINIFGGSLHRDLGLLKGGINACSQFKKSTRNPNQSRQRSSKSHGASGSRRPSTPLHPPFNENETIQEEVPPIYSQPSQDSMPEIAVQPPLPVQPPIPLQPPPQTAPRQPFKIPKQSSRTTPGETITRGLNVHKSSHEQVVHSEQITQQPLQQEHPQSSTAYQQKPKALRKHKKPISSSTKLLKRQQQDAPDQSSQFKRKYSAERNPSISSLIKSLANSYRQDKPRKIIKILMEHQSPQKMYEVQL
ncbi:mental retardation GTPase activating protein homolog 4-like isoform X3 [Sesamum indicum]|uniref:Mental retardation GTPase activating protein homolog 4-like isoform X3 n=1 Tax=Sesamum indicum TaxID=4182 RepID=A0A8M8V9N4_SESIN|nr:mental retardation GTPase activating protein homolog 4-like isoform X3 [Sesamum indicum]